jgi:hypothetical protein
LAWEFSRNGDFDCPDGVGMDDILSFAHRWLAITPNTSGAADGNLDGRIDLSDLSILAERWKR